jgi:hypothetical protein
MKFYDVALAQGVYDKVLAYDFFRFVSGPQIEAIGCYPSLLRSLLGSQRG